MVTLVARLCSEVVQARRVQVERPRCYQLMVRLAVGRSPLGAAVPLQAALARCRCRLAPLLVALAAMCRLRSAPAALATVAWPLFRRAALRAKMPRAATCLCKLGQGLWAVWLNLRVVLVRVALLVV